MKPTLSPVPSLSRSVLQCLTCGLVAAAALGGEPTKPGPVSAGDQSRGEEIIRRFVEVNRYWLMGPPSGVQNFSYVLNRLSGTQVFEVSDPARTSRARLQGVTYSTLLHQLAQAPQSATVTKMTEEKGILRLALTFEPAVRGAIGNGVENSWNGYHNLGGRDGYIVLDTERWVPLEASVGRLTETFGEYARVDGRHWVPLAIGEQIGDTHYDWHFRLYEAGLWLFDESISDGRRLAWVEQVKVNSAAAKLQQATAASLEQAERTKVGQERMEAFLKANRQWLLPSLEARRGLAYEYRQEAPYLERVLIDPNGNLMARLEATKENPERPTRQRLWLADGRSYSGNAADQFVKLEGGWSLGESPEAWLRRDRIVQHLAMGLALDCALTRLAREPENFWAEVRSVPNIEARYLLVLHPKKDARLFTGTMLTFSSSSFMHDVRYDRSEVLCDAATHRPLEERDYAGQTDLKGEYLFKDWLGDASGAAPGRIRAALPYEKEGKDQALEMDAQFRFTKPGLWMLQRVESHFRGEGGGSTGTVTVVSAPAGSFQPIQELLEKARVTEQTLGAMQQAPMGSTAQPIKPGDWSPLPLRASWTEQAQESARTTDERGRQLSPQQPPLIGLHRARLVQVAEGATRVELEGLSTAAWKEFQTEWKVSLQDAQGRLLAAGTTNSDLRAESAPTPFQVRLDLPRSDTPSPSLPQQITVEATVQRMTGAYHGHGMWFRFARKE
jgi:hypothetical protein